MLLAVTMLALAAAAAAPAAPPEPAPQPDLDWLAGYWLSCEDGRDVGETWSERRGGVMLGTNITTARGSSSWEQMRIEYGDQGVSFVAQPRGAERPTAFRLVRSGESEAVFENPEHDFPQRVRYRRDGDLLTARIEGAGGQAMEWRFRTAPLNRRCPL